jgi:hypothetical protein
MITALSCIAGFVIGLLIAGFCIALCYAAAWADDAAGTR